MPRPTLLAALAGASLLASEPAFAHGFAGPHMFVSTLMIDDPNVADEATLPTFSVCRSRTTAARCPTSMRPSSSSTNASPRISASRSMADTSGSPSRA